MRNFLLSALILGALFSCKKEQKPAENPVVTTTETPTPTSAYKTVEFTTDKVANLVNTKNDTLYITNFFATWCGPCMKEIPHFKKKMEELKGQPVKFTFISVDEKNDWETEVKNFAEEQGLSKNVVVLNGATLSPEFFKANFKEWDGSSIPFTQMRKGDVTDETVGMMTEDVLNEKVSKFLTAKK